jgi:hypothetical protein
VKKKPFNVDAMSDRQLMAIARDVDCDIGWQAGSPPRTLAGCCERCVYGTGEHRADCPHCQAGKL